MSLSPSEAGTPARAARTSVRRAVKWLMGPWRRYRAWRRRSGGLLRQFAPRGLLARSLINLIAPVVIMQTIVLYIFLEAHIDTVTRRLSAAMAGDIAIAVDSFMRLGAGPEFDDYARLVQRKSSLSIAYVEGDRLPAKQTGAWYSVVDRTLRREMARRVDEPFWIDAEHYPRHVDIRVQLPHGVMRIIVERARIFLSTGPLVLVWIVGATLVLLAIAVIFLRNQIRPILRLARAAEHFGRGVDVPDFKPSGAREVRIAAQAFLEMKDRLQRHIQQRTEMLAGVSHDLRTPLTRMRLELEMAGGGAELDLMKAEITEMEDMLEAYLAFARGQGGEAQNEIALEDLVREVVAATKAEGKPVETGTLAATRLTVRPIGLRRCLTNLVRNAATHGGHVVVSLVRSGGKVRVRVDDDGPGIAPERREEAFRPFHRLDEGRNLDAGGIGLGLAIARDIARGHGGDVVLSESPMGGLRAEIELPAPA